MEPEQQSLWEGRAGYRITANNEIGISAALTIHEKETTMLGFYWVHVRPEAVTVKDTILNDLLGMETIEGHPYAGANVGSGIDHDRNFLAMLGGFVVPIADGLEAVGEYQYQRFSKQAGDLREDNHVFMFGLRLEIP